MRGHPAGGKREEHMGDDPHGVGALPEGAPWQNHPDHRLVAGQPAVSAAPRRPALTAECGRQSFGHAGRPDLAVWQKLPVVL